MAISGPKQHVPIFVGSTFEDLKEYRGAVRDALAQLETIVRGMEYFGSKPGSPVDECLAAVRSCRVYLGIFGMRYGSVPEGHDRSMTHLEYEEAQRSELPSLIYLLDEESQPVLPKHVETGPGAEALRALKDQLKKHHVVSTFTTPDDLARRVLHDVPEVLRTLGAIVEGELPDKDATSEQVLARFQILPKRFRGRDVVVEFVMDGFSSVPADTCKALRLEVGATVSDYTSLANGRAFHVYASGDLAERVLDIEKGSKVRAEAVTVYGTTSEVQYHEDGSFANIQEHEGIHIKRILLVTPAEKAAS